MNRFDLELHISPERLMDYYRGAARQVVARTPEGVVIRFPANLLTPFVSPEGVHGAFVLVCDDRFAHAELRRKG